MTHRISNMLERLTPNPSKVFLLDGLGAMLTALCLRWILPSFETFFGMPQKVLHFLAWIAAFFALYSLLAAFLKPEHWRAWLRGIAIANFLYCGLTFSLLWYYAPVLTVWGKGYFLGEIGVILLLVCVEWVVSKRDQK